MVVGSDRSSIVQKALNMQPPQAERRAFAYGSAGERILHVLENTLP